LVLEESGVKVMTDCPQMFRLNIEVGDLAAAQTFYETLFGAQGRGQAGNRFYLNAGPVALQVVDVVAFGRTPHPAAKALYFTVTDLDAIHQRAASLNALSTEAVHGLKAGDISVKPWGERSFYLNDPWGTPLCFVDAATVYAG
jgi:catechol-2,3-dioxygenase